MLVMAQSSLVNDSTTATDRHSSSQSVGSQAPEKRKTGLSEDDLLHEELRRHYPVPKNLNEVEKQALTFHVVRHPLERLLSAYRDKLESGKNSHYSAIYGKVSWQQFVNLVLSTSVEKLDEHWRPISLLCSPC